MERRGRWGWLRRGASSRLPGMAKVASAVRAAAQGAWQAIAAAALGLWRGMRQPGPRWPGLAVAGACLTWPLAAPAAWSAVFGSLPPRFIFFALTALVWAGGWAALAAVAVPREAGPRAAGACAPLAALAGGLAAVLWGFAGWFASLLSSPWWAGLLVSLLMWWDAALVLDGAVRVVASAARGDPPRAALGAAFRPSGAPAAPRAALVAAAAAGSWYLLRLYVRLWLPEPLIAPWLAWPLLTAGAGLLLRALLATALAPAATPAGPPKDRGGHALTPGRAAAGLGYVLLAVAAILAGPGIRAALWTGPAMRGVAVAQRLLARGDWAGAAAAARRATAVSAGAYALGLVGSGAATEAGGAALAAVGIDPSAPAAQLATAMVALAHGEPDPALQAAQALAATGAPGRGAYVAALACPQARAPRGCRATAAAQAMWADPRLAWLGPRPGRVDEALAAQAQAELNRAVTEWAQAIATSAGQRQWATSARSAAAWQLLAAYTQALPGLDGSARTELAISGAFAAAGVGDAGGVQAALQPLPPGAVEAAGAATLLFQAGSTYETVAPDIQGGATCSPVPRRLEQAALGAAERQAAPPQLLLAAAQYLILVGNGESGGRCADVPPSTVIGLLQRYTALRPRDVAGWDLLAVAQYEQSAFPLAVRAASRALALGSRNVLAQEIAGESLWGEAQSAGIPAAVRTEELTAAEEHLRAAVRLNPAPFLTWMALGDVLHAEHQPAQALQAYQESQQWLGYDLAHHVETFAAPGEGWGITGLPRGGGGGPDALASRIQTVQQELRAHAG